MGRLLEWFRVRRAGLSTPGRLWIVGLAMAMVIVLLGAVSFRVVTARSVAGRTISTEAAPLLASARGLYLALGDADTTATVSLLVDSSVEHAEARDRYTSDLETAGRLLADLADRADTSPEILAAVRTINELLPQYAAGVEAARANNRQGYPVGSAYLRDASALMQGRILQQATVVYVEAMRELDDAGHAATRRSHVYAVLAAGVLALVVLVMCQWLVSSWSRRYLNGGLVAATLMSVGLVVWMISVFAAQQGDLRRAQQQGSATMEVVSVARMLSLRAQRDDASALIGRGTGQSDFGDFMDRIGNEGGLLDAAGDPSAVRDRLERFVEAHDTVRARDDDGDHNSAVSAFEGTELKAAEGFDAGLAELDRSAEQRFDEFAARADRVMQDLVAVPLLLSFLAIGALSMGLWWRIKEYR